MGADRLVMTSPWRVWWRRVLSQRLQQLLGVLWSREAAAGLQTAATAHERSKPRGVRPTQRGQRAGIVGTGPGSSTYTLRTKLVSVFVTKFTPELEADTITSYLHSKLGRKVTCMKIDTVQSRYSSFKVTAECDDVREMYDPDLWPEGAFVRRFYKVRKSKGATEDVKADVLGGAHYSVD